ncbi:MAG: class I SAM-dependent methyltransferase [Acidimicrobiales bacterium]
MAEHRPTGAVPAPPAAQEPAAQRVAKAVLSLLPGPAQRAVRMRRRDSRLRTVLLGELDSVLDEAAERFARSEDDGRRFLGGLRMAPPPRPEDPFGEAYRAWVWELYGQVSGRGDYSLGHEASPFDFEAALERPFPFATGSATVVGDDLVGRGSVIKALGLAAPARIVELGPGWGNLTADLAAMGHEVTAVDVDEGFCRLIEHRAPGVRVVRGDMLSFAAAQSGAPYDAAVFYESFHHCDDHLRLLELLHAVVGPAGRVVLGAEPVDLLAYPWGPRLDGLSLWSMRRYGWLELGFDERYFAEALRRTGWVARKIAGPTPAATVYVATAAPNAPRVT